MSTDTLIKIKGSSLPLPKHISQTWKGAEVYISAREDSIFVKKVEKKPTLRELLPKLKTLGKKISTRDINTAIQEARKKEALS